MNRKLILILTSIFLFGTPAGFAQDKKENKENTDQKISSIIKKAQKELEEFGHQLGDAIGFEDRLDKDKDRIYVEGAWYMPIYSTNLYKGQEKSRFQSLCKEQFLSKYPKLRITSVAIPQTNWITEPIKKNGKTAGYRQFLYCFILAKDGNEGYVNAKFLFEKTRNAGEEYQIMKDKYPLWLKTDIVPKDVYDKIVHRNSKE